MLDRVAMLFILLGICTFLMMLKEIIRHPHPVRIMNIVWPVTGLYMPFVGWLAWWFFARKSRPAFVVSRSADTPATRQIFSATCHCAAGCVLGDIAAIPLVSLLNAGPFHSLLLTHTLLSLALSLAFNLLFQFFALRQIENLSFFRTLWRAAKSDISSLVIYQAGMFFCMQLAFRFILQDKIDPLLLPFWFMLQLALFTGFIFAWPANKFLLQRGIKPAL